MSNTAFQFKLGKFDCLAVSDGYLVVPGPPPSGVSGKPDMEHGQKMDIICLYINTGKKKILIDTGCGDSFQNTTGQLVRNLAKAGIKPADIDVVIYTHGHLDHVAGSFGAQGQAIFPEARYIAARREWEGWQTPVEKPQLKSMFAAARQNCLAMPEQFDLVEDRTAALPGITLILAPGHTPGNSLLEISSDSRKLLCIGDLVHSEVEFNRPDFYSFLDVDPQQAILSRRQFLNQAAGSGTLVLACHFPFPGLGYIKMKKGLMTWQPISKDSL